MGFVVRARSLASKLWLSHTQSTAEGNSIYAELHGPRAGDGASQPATRQQIQLCATNRCPNHANAHKLLHTIIPAHTSPRRQSPTTPAYALLKYAGAPDLCALSSTVYLRRRRVATETERVGVKCSLPTQTRTHKLMWAFMLNSAYYSTVVPFLAVTRMLLILPVHRECAIMHWGGFVLSTYLHTSVCAMMNVRIEQFRHGHRTFSHSICVSFRLGYFGVQGFKCVL